MKRAKTKRFPIVGVGASAGGLRAFSQLLKALPDKIDLAFVLVQHLAPGYDSNLTDILSRQGKVPVSEVTDNVLVRPNRIYVCPPNSFLQVQGKRLRLKPISGGRKKTSIIDYFFTSLARAHKSNAVGVVLSGTGSDGTEGLKAIKAQRGFTFAQDEATAQFPEMPQSAKTAGWVDLVLSPKNIARELINVSRRLPADLSSLVKGEISFPRTRDAFENIYTIIRNETGVDFSHYKQSTIKRRLKRRLGLKQIKSIDDYIRLLHKDHREIEALFGDLLINVTGFFRDPAQYKALKTMVLPRVLKHLPPDGPLRIWVPACSTGEEVYSIAICLLEQLEKAGSRPEIQIFATDVSEECIEQARLGIYPDSISRHVSADRLRIFFDRVKQGYQVKKRIREKCVFARHDLTRDPPFTRIDLLSCRNLLIYLEPVLQKRAVLLFHYALNPRGVLLLGKAESISQHTSLFKQIDKRNHIYAKKELPAGPAARPQFYGFGLARRGSMKKTAEPAPDLPAGGVLKEADRFILDNFAPPGVVVNEELDILRFLGRVSPYLEPTPGDASLNLMKMLREELQADARAALFEARKKRGAVKREGLRFLNRGKLKVINLLVSQVRDPSIKEKGFLVLFEEVLPPVEAGGPIETTGQGRGKHGGKERLILRLNREIEANKKLNKTVVEDLEAANEELKTAMEELQSSNEELQSTNEELETSKEELQSANEELLTLNDEVKTKNDDLERLNRELDASGELNRNLLETLRHGLLVLDHKFRIIQANRYFCQTFKVSAKETEGRLIYDLGNGQWAIPALRRLLEKVLPKKRAFSNFEVTHDFKTIGRRTMLLNGREVLPRVKAGKKILLAIEDLTERKRAEELLEAKKEELQVVLNAIPDIILSLDRHGSFISYSAAKGALYLPPEKFLGRKAAEVLPPFLARLTMRNIRRTLRSRRLQLYEYDLPIKGVARSFEVRMVPAAGETVVAIIRDITEKKQAAEALRREKEWSSSVIKQSPVLIVGLGKRSKILLFNDFAEQVTGYKAEEVLGKRWIELFIPKAQRRQLYGVWKKIVQNGLIEHHYDNPIIIRNGQKRQIAWTNSVFKGPEGVNMVLSIGEDVTEQRRSEQLKEELIAAVSHELKSPVAVSQMAVEVGKRGVKEGDLAKIDRSCRIIESNIGRLSRDVNNIVDAFSLSFRKAMPRKINLRPLVKQLLAERKSELSAKGLKAAVGIRAGAGTVLMNERDLSILLAALIDNAIKFSDKGKISVFSRPAGRRLEITVRDQGRGLTRHEKENAFVTFFKGSAARRGVGLGLSLCQKIVQRYNGEIDLFSQGRGKGTSVKVRLPGS